MHRVYGKYTYILLTHLLFANYTNLQEKEINN